MGNINLAWLPSDGTATCTIFASSAQGQVIDVLKTAKFEHLQRETGLEQSSSPASSPQRCRSRACRSATRLEFAVTVLRHDPTLGDRSFGLSQLTLQRMPGAFRFQLSWPDKMKLNWRATRDLPAAVPVSGGGRPRSPMSCAIPAPPSPTTAPRHGTTYAG